MTKFYDKIVYPDGQISIKLLDKPPEEIIFRINSYNDLMELLSLSEVMDYLNHEKKTLIIPCLFGQRSDRRFSHTQSFDLKVITNLINSCNFNQVKIFDPHSDVSLALINRSVKMDSLSFVIHTIQSLSKKHGIKKEDLILISPDAGAYKKVFYYGELLELPVVTAIKYRDVQGNVTLNFTESVKDKVCLIIDDLCDGGYTFEVLGKKLNENGSAKNFLYVTHGYFSKGFNTLKQVLNGVYCTNTVKDIETDDFVTQFNID